ncbi:preprotein translocase subunit SecE [Corynebacterium epidermidicanis]|uniref:Protein translocase subunit SecE n=1 Tax=Corynebacterium epidermidicanis TaxID=1050174 RepID=A0A0G3GM71_9CORY|nr:preprotein translocase subunit SecE [Corynebacterium epidermidicanis]AKK02244.1 preprotein translocase, SecE subunit [Corynebacterium epidermidicanis]
MSEDRQPANEAGAARPTGKRQLTGASTTSTAQMEAKKATRVSDDSEKVGGGVASFLPEVGSELKKVIWPTAKQMVVYTTIVFVFLIIMTALVSGVDWLAGLGVEKVLGA